MSEDRNDPARFSGDEGTKFARENLIQIKVDDVKWQVLWRDPKTGEFWKEYFSRSEMHGGGPSEFVKITEEDAKNEFGSW